MFRGKSATLLIILLSTLFLVQCARNSLETGSNDATSLFGMGFLFATSPITIQAGGLDYEDNNTFNFGTVTTGSTSQLITLTIQNTGTENITFPAAPVAVSGDNAADFTVSDPGITDLAPGATATFTVIFTPGGDGNRDGVLAILNSENEVIYTLNLTGSGSATPVPDIYVEAGGTYYASGSGYDFGSFTLGFSSTAITFTIRNSGQSSLTLTGSPVVATGGADASDFTVSGPAGAAIPAGATDSFTVTFTPTSMGQCAANITVQSNDPDVPSYTINLTGTGIALPTISPVTIASNNANTSIARPGDTVTLSFTADVAIQTPTVTIAGNAAAVSGGPTSWTATYTMTAADAEGAVPFVISNIMNLAGAPVADVTATTDGSGVTFDRTVPAGYTVAIDQAMINAANQAACSFTFTGAEIGTTYDFTITSSGGGTAVTGSGTVTAANQQITGINVSGLNNGILTLGITLTDAAGNAGTAVNATAMKDGTAPAGYTAVIDQAYINSINVTALSLTFASAEVGSIYSFTISSSGGGTDVTGSGAVGAPSQSLVSIDVSGLNDGILTLSFILTDAAGNAGAAATDTAVKDTMLPLVGLTSTPAINAANQSAYSVSGTCSDNGRTVTVAIGGSFRYPTCASGIFTTAALDVSGLPQGPVSITADLSDIAGNIAVQASSPVTKDTLAPAVAITAPAGGATVTGPAIITFTDSELTSPAVSVDNVNWTGATSGVTTLADIPQFAGLGDGGIILYLRDIDAAGNTGSASIGLIKDTTAPTLTITGPVNGSTVTGSAIISFTDSEPNNPEVSVDNINWYAATSGVTMLSAILQFPALPQGGFTLYLRDTDAVGNTGSYSIALTKDTAAPNVAITAPAGGASVNGSAVIAFTDDELTGPQVSVDNSNWYAATSGSTMLSVIPQFAGLGEGGFTLYLRDTDAAGNTGTASIGLIKDTTAANVAITAPAAGASVNDTITVSFASDGIAPQISVDNVNWYGATSGVTTLSAIPQFAGLGQGGFTLYLRDTDTAGNTGTDSIGLIKDTIAPNVSITVPLAGASVNNSVIISFTNDGTNPQVSVDNVNWHAATSGVTMLSAISQFPALPQGGFTLYLRDTDGAGNIGSTSVGLTKDTAGPNVAITAPSAGASVNGTAVISFTDDDLTNPEVSVDNVNWHAATSGVTMLSAISQFGGLGQGGFTLYLRDIDGGGNTGSTSIGLVKDTTSPNVAIIAPAGGATVTGTTVIGFTDDGSAPQISVDTINWYAATSGVSMLSDIFEFAGLGEIGFTLYLRDIDAAGNTGSASISLTKDTTAPNLVITGPANGSTVTGSAIITFTDSEPNNPEVSVDNINWYAASSGVTMLSAISQFPALSQGGFTLYLRDTDAVGNTGTYFIGLTKDTTSPNVAIIAPSGGASVNGTAVISFTDDDLTNPEVSVDNVNWHAATSGVTMLSAISQFGGLGQGGFTLYLRDIDSAGNTGSTSVGLIKDTAAPNVAIIAPSAGASVNGTAVISFTDDDLTNPEVSVDNVNWHAATSGVTMLSAISLFGGLGQGGFTLYLRDIDSAGNTGSASVGLTKDTVGPNVSIIAPSAGASVNGTAVIAFTDDDLTNPEVSVDNVNWHAATSGVTMLSAISQFGGLGQGGFTLYLRDTDGGGNTGSSSIGLIKDTISPTVSLAALAPIAGGNQNSYAVSGTCSENGGTVSLTIGDGTTTITPTAGCSLGMFSTNVDLTVMQEGPVMFYADHADTAGNNAVQASTTATKDTIPPTVAIGAPSTSAVNGSGSVDFGITYAGADTVNLTSPSVSLTTTGDASCAVSVADGTTSSPTVTLFSCSGNGTVRISIASGTSFDTAGNTNFAGGPGTPVTVDTLNPSLSFSSVGPINAANAAAYVVSGFCTEEGMPVTVTVGGSVSNSPICTGGMYTTASMDVSSILDNGSVNVAASHSDAAGNTENISTPVVKDTVIPTLTMSPVPGTITYANQNAYTVSGVCSEEGQMVTVTVIDDESSSVSQGPTCSSGWYSTALNVSGLSDGVGRLTITHTDGAGNTRQIGIDPLAKDTAYPVMNVRVNNVTYASGVSTYDFGTIRCAYNGAATVDIYNTGTATLILPVSPVSFGGLHSTDFSISDLESGSIAINPGEMTTFVLRFAPGGEFARDGIMFINSNDPVTPTYTLMLTGIGTFTNVPNIAVKIDGVSHAPGSVYNFGTVETGTSKKAVVDIYNNGVAPLTLTNASPVTLDGGAMNMFSISDIPNGPITIPQYGMATCTVTFTPTAGSTHSTTLRVTSDDPDYGTYALTIEGTGAFATPVPDVEVRIDNVEMGHTSTYNFGNIDTAHFKTVTVEIRNRGTANLTLGTGVPVQTTGTHFPDFALDGSEPGDSAVITAGTSSIFTMTFTPGAVGLRVAQFKIFSDDPDIGTYVVNLKGKGVGSATPDISIEIDGAIIGTNGTFDFGAVLADGSVMSVPVSIINHGTTGLMIVLAPGSIITGPAGADFTNDGTWAANDIIPAGSSIDFNIVFSPSEEGLRTALLVVGSSDIDAGSYFINLRGVGVMPRVIVCGGNTSDSAIYDPITGTFSAGNPTGSQTVNAGGHSFKMQDGSDQHVLIYGNNSYWAIFNPASATFVTQSSFGTNANQGANSFPVVGGNYNNNNIILLANGSLTRRFSPPSSIVAYDSLSGIGYGSFTFPIPSAGGQIMIIHGGFSTTLSVFDPLGNAGNGSFMTIGNTLTSGAQNGAHSIMIDAPDSPNFGSVLVILGGGSNGVNLYTSGSFDNFGGKTLSGSAGQGASSVPILTGLHRGKRLIIHAGASPGTPATTLFNPLVDDATTFTPGPNLYNNYNASYGSFSFVVEHGPNAGLIVVVHGGSSFRTSVCDPKIEPLQFNAGPNLPYSGYQYSAGDGAHSFPLK